MTVRARISKTDSGTPVALTRHVSNISKEITLFITLIFKCELLSMTIYKLCLKIRMSLAL